MVTSVLALSPLPQLFQVFQDIPNPASPMDFLSLFQGRDIPFGSGIQLHGEGFGSSLSMVGEEEDSKFGIIRVQGTGAALELGHPELPWIQCWKNHPNPRSPILQLLSIPRNFSLWKTRVESTNPIPSPGGGKGSLGNELYPLNK